MRGGEDGAAAFGDLDGPGPTTRHELAALVRALLQIAVVDEPAEGTASQRPGATAVVSCEVGPTSVRLASPEPFRLALDTGTTTARNVHELSRSEAESLLAPDPSGRPECLVGLRSPSGTMLLLDLVAATVVSLVGSDAAVDDSSSMIIRQAATHAYGPVARVIAVGRELRAAAEATDAVPVARVEEALEVLRRLESGGRIDPTQSSLVVVSRDAFRSASVSTLVAFARSRPWCCLVLPAPVRTSQVLLAPNGGEYGVFFLASGAPPVGQSGIETFCDSLLALDPPVEVAVLGQIEVRGASGSLERRPKLTELIVYLAMHPEGASSTTWQQAIWPDRRVPAQTVANRLSEARRLLGMELDGRPRLRHSTERHRLAGVTTDWERFRHLADSKQSPEAWREALELVRGRPFDDLQEGHWTVFEGFQGEIETAIIDCALRYGEERLAAGDPDAAAWAGQRAIRANPYDERPWRLMMRAADAAGNRSGVEAIYRNLVIVMDIEDDGMGSVHPETAALYERLSGRSERSLG